MQMAPRVLTPVRRHIPASQPAHTRAGGNAQATGADGTRQGKAEATGGQRAAGMAAHVLWPVSACYMHCPIRSSARQADSWRAAALCFFVLFARAVSRTPACSCVGMHSRVAGPRFGCGRFSLHVGRGGTRLSVCDFHSIPRLGGRLGFLVARVDHPRESEYRAPFVSETGLGVCRVGDGIGWAIYFLAVFRGGIECVWGGFAPAGRCWGKVLGVSCLSVFLP